MRRKKFGTILFFSSIIILLLIFSGIYYFFNVTNGDQKVDNSYDDNDSNNDLDNEEDENESIENGPNPEEIPENVPINEEDNVKSSNIILNDPLILINDSDVRVNDSFSIWIDEKDDQYSDEIKWDFDDGTILIGSEVVHFFRTSDIFNVRVLNRNDKVIAKFEMKIKHRNEIIVYSEEGFIDLQYYTAEGAGRGALIKEGISEPTFIFNITIYGATGKIGIEIDVVDPEYYYEKIYFDLQEVIYEDLFYHVEILPTDYLVLENPMSVLGGPYIQEGRCASYEVIIFVFY